MEVGGRALADREIAVARCATGYRQEEFSQLNILLIIMSLLLLSLDVDGDARANLFDLSPADRLAIQLLHLLSYQ